MLKSMCAAGLLAALFLFGTGATAQDVTLTSPDGAVEISGTLLSFDGEFYRVDTIYGELTVDGSGVSCEGPGCPSLTDFVAELDLSGAQTLGRLLMPALIEAFAQRKGLTVEREKIDADHVHFHLVDKDTGRAKGLFRLRATSTDEGFADLIADEADIAMAIREVTRDEKAHARAAGLGDLEARGQSRVVALDALVAMVAPGNPVGRISISDLPRVFAGEIDNWQVLGGPDAPITLHLRNEESGLGQAGQRLLLDPAGATVHGAAIRHRSDEALAKGIARDPFGLALASFAARGDGQMLVLTGSCGFSLSPTRRNVKTEDYPLVAPMFLYAPARRLPKLAREFLAFTTSSAAQIVIRRAGFLDQQPEEIALNDQGDRFANAIAGGGAEIGLSELQEMVAALRGLKRLSTSFRFDAGSARLDAQSRSNIDQLARALEAGRYDGRRLVFVGFSDGQGAAEVNRRISLQRAQAVRRAVTAAAETANMARVDVQVMGFGEALPMACDDSAWGRGVNRRVEIWVR